MGKNKYTNDLLMEAGKRAEIPVIEGRMRPTCRSNAASQIDVSGSTGFKYLKIIADRDFALRKGRVLSNEPKLPW